MIAIWESFLATVTLWSMGFVLTTIGYIGLLHSLSYGTTGVVLYLFSVAFLATWFFMWRDARNQFFDDPIGDDASETIQSITTWADETFGPATIQRQIERAHEEMQELREAFESAQRDREVETFEHETTLKIAEEAADVCICLYRVIGSLNPDALDQKMRTNRARTWKIDRDGCAYHVKESAT